jgi:hypothetical protein
MTAFLLDLVECRIDPYTIYFDHPPDFVPFDAQYGQEPAGIRGFGVELNDPDRDGKNLLDIYIGHPVHFERVKADLAEAEIQAPAQLVELYAWHNGTQQARWEKFKKMHPDGPGGLEGKPFEFLPGVVYPTYQEAIAEYRRLGSERPLWRAEWFPVFLTSRGRLAVECTGDGPVWLVPFDDEAAAALRSPSLAALLKEADGRFESGAWEWRNEEWAFRVAPGSEL